MIDFQESAIWKTKFIDLNHRLQKYDAKAEIHGSEVIAIGHHAENTILEGWNSLSNSFETMKRFAVALITMFGSTYSCQSCFHT